MEENEQEIFENLQTRAASYIKTNNTDKKHDNEDKKHMLTLTSVFIQKSYFLNHGQQG